MTAPTKNTTTPTAAAVPMAAAVVEMAAVVVPDTAWRRRQLTRAIKESLRELDPSDRRAVVVRALRDRTAELFRLYSGMNTAMDQLCASYELASDKPAGN
jgi:hypothetical protein